MEESTRNDRLATAMRQAGISQTRLAAVVGVDPKTVERWINGGRTPHRRHRDAVAAALVRAPSTLWDVDDRGPDGTPNEVVTIHPSRRHLSHAAWQALMAGVTQRFELHAFAATFLPDQAMDLAAELIGLADRDVKVRMLLGDPQGAAVAKRDAEEGGMGLAGRVMLVLGYLSRAIADPRIDVRLHDETLYASTFRFDDDLLVNLHVWGSPAGSNPLLHLRGPDNAPLIRPYQQGFERVWDTARPLTTWPRPEEN
ncbi:helix-turn-helix domain-containing protein [Myceligenerans crystallogenes]|uniref:XRE family transcriptional regulator n=1 Tax=Myceligenerans crystallogenes TaxID=316335 RepID=A0ABN2NAD6_9MICO